ncbi:hypothetical protein [uncultured Chitinophaga sp.]|uniref:hypothetical protein n=1 Tax=uncultured Chitinophaga sp. TaxID=339340 RepID=UPI0025EEDDC1|nr:hypothetical protein [uncultured Chitinophaga sp.]
MAQVKLWLTVVMVFCCSILHAQVSFVFIPEIQGRTVDGLFMVRTVNMNTQRSTATLTISVTERVSGKIVQVQSAPFDLLPGNNPLPPSMARNASVLYGNARESAVTRQSGYFMEGDYDYCFQLFEGKSGAGTLLAEQCFQYYLKPFSPLLLIRPGDMETLCDKRPAFFWQPILPAVPGVLYRLALVELKANQHKTEGMNVNLPLINQRNIGTPMLFFPAVNKDLEEGKRYAWQVTAYKGVTMLSQSEIWEFTCICTLNEKDSLPDAFRNIEDLAKGNFYLAEGRVMFAMNNPYAATNLTYSVLPISNPQEKIKKLRKVKLTHGLNYVVIDLRDNASFVDGHYYQLQVNVPGGNTKALRFLYKSPVEQ